MSSLIATVFVIPPFFTMTQGGTGIKNQGLKVDNVKMLNALWVFNLAYYMYV